MALQIPSQLVAEHVGLPYWIGFLMVGWGITATLMAGLTSSPTHLYLLRFFLGLILTHCPHRVCTAYPVKRLWSQAT